MKKNPIPSDYYERAIENNLIQRFYHLTRFGKIAEFIGEVDGDFLDVGCASGILTEKIASKSSGRGWGIDINPGFITYAKKNRPHIHFSTAKVEKLPFPKYKFNLVICSEVLEHVASPQKALEECRRVLKKEGRLIITVPSESFLFRLLWFFWTKMKGKVWRGTHLNHFREKTLDRQLNKSGFKVLRRMTLQLGMLLIIEAKKFR